MLRIPLRHGLCASIVWLPFVLSSAGCGAPATTDGPVAAPAAASAKVEPPGEEADSDVRAELAKLPPEDRVLAEKQKVCPVSGELLGSMGVPFKVAVHGRTVFLCCGGCQEELQKNVDKYLAKLDRIESFPPSGG